MPIIVRGLTHTYNPDSPLEATAIEDVDLEIRDGEFLGIIGSTGSGKSTLIQHLNGLLKPTRGSVVVDDVEIAVAGRGGRKGDLKAIRQKVGLIFQYPEHQLFEETVRVDVAFGPKNLGLPSDEVEVRVREALRMVGLGEELLERSPFELSGGQMRRVAIAGVLAMRPKVLILDEPTAGLDPRGREEILGGIKSLHDDYGLTVVLVSHSMEDIARLAERVIVMHRGRVVMSGTTREVFGRADELRAVGLDAPQVTRLMRILREKGFLVRTDLLTVEEARAEILRSFPAAGGPKGGAGRV